MRRIAWIALAAVAAHVAVGTAATAIGRGAGSEEVSASFEARTVGGPTITVCKDTRGEEFLEFEASYQGTLRTEAGEEYVLGVRGLEVVADPTTGLGTGEAQWLMQVPDEPEVVARGELTAVFVGDPNQIGDPHIIGDPSIFQGELHGMLVGFEDPDERQILWNFAGSAGGEGTTGAIGNPNSAPIPAVTFPPDPC